MNPPYFVDPFLNRANGNVPPRLRVTDGGPELQGPSLPGVAAAFRAVAGEPTRLTAWARDTELEIPPPPRARGRQRPPLSVTWRKYRGPGAVTFDEATYEYESLAGGEAATMATFDEPGVYRLTVTANDISGNGGGGDQCCWTTVHVDVLVMAAPDAP